jgi:hypothetical protein
VTQETDLDLILPMGDTILYLFGSEERKNKWWRQNHPNNGDSIYFMSVSTNPVRIIGDIRVTKDGKYVVNPLSLGHEFLHAMRIIDSKWTLRNEDDGRLLSPDKYINI